MFCECGTGSFKHVDEDPDDLVGCTGGGSPKDKERRKQHGGGKVNPYAERGLDRFSVVLSELETRRAKILRRVGGSDTGLLFVRFAQSNNGNWTPIIVKLPEQPPPPSKKAAAATKKPAARAAAASIATTLRPSAPPAASSPRSPPPDYPGSPREGATAKVVVATSNSNKIKVPARKASFSLGRRMRRPSCYWPSVIVLTLVSLAMFGRVFAICLASIWWYVLPTLSSADDGAGEGVRRSPAGMRMSMEKRKVVSPPPHAKKGSSISGVYEVVRSPKGKRG